MLRERKNSPSARFGAGTCSIFLHDTLVLSSGVPSSTFQCPDGRERDSLCWFFCQSLAHALQVGVTGPLEVIGVMGLCEEGVALLLIRSVTSTSSPTRSTAPDGPAQAYWPKTGLSGFEVVSKKLKI